MKYGFKYSSNSSFRIVEATDSAGYEIKELRDILKTHHESELRSLYLMSDEEFINYYGVNDENSEH